MPELTEQLHRTWVQYLIDTDLRELAAIVLDGELHIIYDDWQKPDTLTIDLPATAYNFVRNDESIKQAIKQTIMEVVKPYVPEDVSIIAPCNCT